MKSDKIPVKTLSLTGPDRNLIREKLLSSYDVFGLKPLVQEAIPTVERHIGWSNPGGDAAIISEVVTKAEA